MLFTHHIVLRRSAFALLALALALALVTGWSCHSVPPGRPYAPLDVPDIRGEARFSRGTSAPPVAEVEVVRLGIQRVELRALRYSSPAATGQGSGFGYPMDPDHVESRPGPEAKLWFTQPIELPYAHIFAASDPDLASIWLEVRAFTAARPEPDVYEAELFLEDRYFAPMWKKKARR